jgi:hypothetical protein
VIRQGAEACQTDFVVYWVDGGPPCDASYAEFTPAAVVITSRYVEQATTLYRLLRTPLPEERLADLGGRYFLQLAAEYALRGGDPVTATYLMTGSMTLVSVYFLPHASVVELELDDPDEDYMIGWFYALTHEIGHVVTGEGKESYVPPEFVEKLVNFVISERKNADEAAPLLEAYREGGRRTAVAHQQLTDEINADTFGVDLLLSATSQVRGFDFDVQDFGVGMLRMHKARGMMQIIERAAYRLTQDWKPPEEDPFFEVAIYARTVGCLSTLAELLALNTESDYAELQTPEDWHAHLQRLDAEVDWIADAVRQGLRLAVDQVLDAGTRDATVADGLAEMISKLPDKVGEQARLDSSRFFELVDELGIQHRDLEGLRLLVDQQWVPRPRTLHAIYEKQPDGQVFPALYDAGSFVIAFVFESTESSSYRRMLETALEAHAEGVQVLEAALTCEWDWQASIWVTEAFPEDVRPAVRVLIEGTPLFDRVWADLEVASEQ